MKVWVAIARTECSETYVYVFEKEPTNKEVILLVYQEEAAADLEFYEQTVYPRITEQEVRPNDD